MSLRQELLDLADQLDELEEDPDPYLLAARLRAMVASDEA